MNRLLLGYSPDLDIFDESPPAPHAKGARVGWGREASNAEANDTEHAAELLEVAGQPRLSALLTRLLRRAAGAALRPSVEAELVRLLQRASVYALPTTGARSHQAPARASRFFGIELEGLSAEDQEFESARRFVQLVEAAARAAALAPPGLPPAATARLAAARAAKRHAPGWPAAHAASSLASAPEPLIREDHRRGSRPFPFQGAQHA